MPAFSLDDQIHAWALDEAQQCSFTDQIGVTVSWLRIPGSAIGSTADMIQWTFLITVPSMLVGVPALANTFTIGLASPPEEMVREGVRNTIERMRAFRTQQNRVEAPNLPPGLTQGSG